MKKIHAGYDIVVDTTKVGDEIEKITQEISTRVIGQSRAINHLLRAFVSEETNLRDPKLPLGVIILAGPSGVGKSLTAKEAAKAYLRSSEKDEDYPITMVDCSTLSQSHQTASLIGSPAGYVGYSDLPILHWLNIDKHHFLIKASEEIKKSQSKEEHDALSKIFKKLKASITELSSGHENQKTASWDFVEKQFNLFRPLKSIVLFDEIEKAHPKFWNLLLPVLENGELQLANGEVTNFRNSFIVLTTNTGSREIQDLIEKPLGFTPAKRGQEKLDQEIYETAKRAIEKTFPAEFIGRFGGEIVVFRTLSKENYFNILENFLSELQVRLSKRNPLAKPISADYTSAFKEFLVEGGISQKYGARILRNRVKKYVTDCISAGLSSQELMDGDQILFDMREDKPMLLRQQRVEMPKPVIVPVTNVSPVPVAIKVNVTEKN